MGCGWAADGCLPGVVAAGVDAGWLPAEASVSGG